MRACLRAIVKRVVYGKPVPPLSVEEQWAALLNGGAMLGEGVVLRHALLQVRDPQNCTLAIGTQSDLECRLCFEKVGATIRIGARTHIGGDTLIDSACAIEIGDDVQIAFGVTMMDHNSHSVRFHERRNDVLEWQQGRKDWTHVPMAPIRIGDKAWIGASVIILKGVTIGEGAIVGAGSVVTKDVAPWTIAAGNPARLIRPLTEEERA